MNINAKKIELLIYTNLLYKVQKQRVEQKTPDPPKKQKPHTLKFLL